MERVRRKTMIKTQLSSQELTTRNNQMLIMYMENYALDEVGQKFGVTRERVRQIISGMGYKTRTATPVVIRETLTKTRHCRLTTKEMFFQNVSIKSKNECWLWKGCKNLVSGYGLFQRKNMLGEVYAHRISFMLQNKRRPKNHILHSCDNRQCVNPHHLRDGTQADNVADRQARRYDLWHTNLVAGKIRTAKFSDQDIARMTLLRKNGKTHEAIAVEMQSCESSVRSILSGKVSIYKKFLDSAS